MATVSDAGCSCYAELGIFHSIRCILAARCTERGAQEKQLVESVMMFPLISLFAIL